MKKQIILLITLLLCFIMCSCGSAKNTASEVKNITSKAPADTEATNGEETTTQDEAIITQEESNTSEEPIVYGRSIHMGSPNDYVLKYKDFIIEHFDNRIFQPGEIYNCLEELNALGYDPDVYGNAYAYVYGEIELRVFELIESGYEYDFSQKMDSFHNYIVKNISDRPFKLKKSV